MGMDFNKKMENRLFCEKHKIFYGRKREILGRVVTPICPKCNQESTESRKKREDEDREYKGTMRDCLEAIWEVERLYSSGLSENSINFTPKETDNFKKYKKYLKVDKNLVIFGDIGTGKTTFAKEIIKNMCKEEKCYYIQGYELLGLNIKDFRFDNKLEPIKRAKILVIDECHNLSNISREILELIVDCVYQNNGFIVFAGNIRDNFIKETFTDRIRSRLNEKGIEILKFIGKDLRKSIK